MKPKRMFAAVNMRKSDAYSAYVRDTAQECRAIFHRPVWGETWQQAYTEGWRVVPVIVTLEKARKK